MLARRLTIGAIFLLASSGLRAQAKEPPRMRVVVRTGRVGQSDVIQRIRGQTSDLPVQLIEVQGRVLEPYFAAQLHTADTLARDHNAQVVVWLDVAVRQEVQILVYLAAPKSGRILVKQLRREPDFTRHNVKDQAEEDGESLSSGELETIALVVRTTLLAIVSGGEIGVTPKQTVTSHVEVTTEKNVIPQQSAPEPTVASRFKALAFIGWQVTVDGLSPLGQQGVNSRLGFLWYDFELSIFGSVSVPADREERFVTLTLSRHTASVYSGFALLKSTGFQVHAGVHGGAAFFVRSSSTDNPLVTPSADRMTPSLLLGPELRVSTLPRWLGLSLTLALDIVPRPPRFVYQREETLYPIRSLWVFQPRISAGFEAQIP